MEEKIFGKDMNAVMNEYIVVYDRETDRDARRDIESCCSKYDAVQQRHARDSTRSSATAEIARDA